ncbi:MAG TPA: DedA family protein [Thermoplasmata archaeon]|nr:DedA family protein [Thermoplasmata archaeon]
MISLVADVANLVVRILSTIGLPGLFALMVVESFGIPPLPSEVILPFAGFLVAEGVYSWEAAVVTAIAGALVGSFIAYGVGRWGRERATGLGLGAMRLEPRHLERMDRFFARYGEVTVAVARVIPIVRAYISYPAGAAEMSPVRFGVYTTVGAIPFTLALVYAGIVLRAHWTVVASYFTVLDPIVIALLAAAIVYFALLVAGVITPGWPPRRRPRGVSPSGPPPAG